MATDYDYDYDYDDDNNGDDDDPIPTTDKQCLTVQSQANSTTSCVQGPWTHLDLRTLFFTLDPSGKRVTDTLDLADAIAQQIARQLPHHGSVANTRCGATSTKTSGITMPRSTVQHACRLLAPVHH